VSESKFYKTGFRLDEDEYGLTIIRKAKSADEEMDPSFDSLKSKLMDILESKRLALQIALINIELNIQAIQTLEEKDTRFLSTDSRNLH